MSNEEQHEMLCSILTKLVDVLNCIELSLLANCCVVRVEDFYGPPIDKLINGNQAPIKPVETLGEISWDLSHQTMADQISNAYLPAHSSVAASR